MKPERRQELYTNELSQKIEKVRDYLRQNATTLTVVAVVAVGVLGGGFWHFSRQRSRLRAGWRQLGPDPALTDPGQLIDRYKSVAAKNLDKDLTIAAWLQVGNTAMGQLQGTGTSGTDTAGGTETRDWAAIAQDAYSQVIRRARDDLTALGKAMIALGILAENRADVVTARQWYQKVLDDKRFQNGPFQTQAAYRLAGLDRWSSPITFAPPPPAVLLPEGSRPTLDETSARLSNTGATTEPALESDSAAVESVTTRPSTSGPAGSTSATGAAPTTEPSDKG